MSYIG